MYFLISVLVGDTKVLRRKSQNGYTVSSTLDDGCVLDVAWKVIFCSKRYPLSLQYQHNEGKGDDEYDKNRYVGIVKDDRDMP